MSIICLYFYVLFRVDINNIVWVKWLSEIVLGAINYTSGITKKREVTGVLWPYYNFLPPVANSEL